jgi:hypothetical protein
MARPVGSGLVTLWAHIFPLYMDKKAYEFTAFSLPRFSFKIFNRVTNFHATCKSDILSLETTPKPFFVFPALLSDPVRR